MTVRQELSVIREALRIGQQINNGGRSFKFEVLLKTGHTMSGMPESALSNGALILDEDTDRPQVIAYGAIAAITVIEAS